MGKYSYYKDKIIIGASILVLIIILIPLIYIAKYNHSCADDYSYGILTHQSWKNTHSIIEVVKTAIKQVGITYQNWQGTFSAVFLMAFQPAIFGEEYYWITTFLVIGTFIIANMYILKIILKDYFKCDSKNYWIITSLILIFSIQFVPYPVESFYWYNGSVYYTFFYSIMLVLIGVVLKSLKEENKKRKIIYFCIGIALSIVIGGANYTTALVCNLIILSIVLILIAKKNKNFAYVVGIFLICFISLLISAKAPGNSFRQETMTKMTEIDAILYSFEYSIVFIKEWTNSSILWLYVLLIPILLKLVKQTNFKYKMPLLFTIFTFCIYSAQFTPPIYAQNGIVPSRLFNIIYFSMYWFIIINITYWLGYINSKMSITENKKNDKYIYIILIILGIIAVMSNYKNMNSYIAIKSIQTGEVYQYDNEIKERIKLYENKDIKDVEVNSLNVKPYLLYNSDISNEIDDWMNKAVSDFYNKNSVKRK